MEIIISVYSPTGKYTAKQITPNMENDESTKTFLGPINSTKNMPSYYTCQIWRQTDAKGFWSIKHPTSTTGGMPEMMGLEMLRTIKRCGFS